MARLLKKEGIENNDFLFNYSVSVIVGIIASRIAFYLLNFNYYSSFYQLFEVWNGGLTSFAGFIAGFITFLLITNKKNQGILSSYLDLAGIAFPLGIAIGRIGCVLNGEVGIRTKSIFAYYGHMPVTAFEIFVCSAIFTINFYFYLHFKKRLAKYTLFYNFSLGYLLARIIIDQWRTDPKILLGLNYGQLFSVMLFLVLTIFFLKNHINFSSQKRRINEAK